MGTVLGDDYHDGPSSSSSSSSKLQSSSLVSFISGGVGGAFSVLVGHPLDLVKVRIQTSTTNSSYISVSGMLANTIRTEGIRGLFRGVSAPLVTVVPVTALSFWGYDIGQQFVRSFNSSSSSNDQDGRAALSTIEICIAGAIAAIPTTFILAPTERIKCLLQVQNHQEGNNIRVLGGAGADSSSRKKYTGSFDCTRQVLKEGGVRSLYKGTTMTLIRGLPGTMAYFGMYEYSKREIMLLQNINPNTTEQLSLSAIIIAGGLAGMAYWSVGIPIVADVIKSRYQTAPPGRYIDYVHVYRSLINEKEGYAGLFKGYKPAVLRAIPASMARSLGMEATRKVLEFV